MFGSTKKKGDRGEELAEKELKKRGYKIVERNYRAARGEIDIIAEKSGTIVFIEVKARADAAFGTPFDAVDPRKQRRIIAAAEAWLAFRKIADRAVRFDVVGIDFGKAPPAVEILENAFTA